MIYRIVSIAVDKEPAMDLSRFRQRLAKARTWHAMHPDDKWHELYLHFEGVSELLKIAEEAFDVQAAQSEVWATRALPADMA